ncbi:DUF4267 domain-containing protein [Streptomyces narbonensis]|uniref:DUF4267 domain-containing protein n=1 Tax=Streptomyces narbonensis TaxID=67333 RepID=UPI003F54200A
MVVNGLLIMRETVSLKKINTVLAATFILFILWFGTEYILSPETTAPGYGLPSWPSGDGDGFLVIKGIRDVVLALVPQPA